MQDSDAITSYSHLIEGRVISANGFSFRQLIGIDVNKILLKHPKPLSIKAEATGLLGVRNELNALCVHPETDVLLLF